MSHHRPDKLQFKNLRAISPVSQFYNSNQNENHLSPNSPSTEKPDLNVLKHELYQKNGVLLIQNKEISTKMEEFEIEKSLGHGTCGTVYQMRHSKLKDIPMAVKQMRPSSHCFEENKRIFRDLYVVTRCQDCPFIVMCYGIFISQSDVWICMEVMETCLDKLLKTTKRPFPEHVIGKVSCAIIKALQYLKGKHNIMHRDIKPSNMLLSNRGEVKLCDFGISAKLKDSIANSRQPGCIGYMAPERLKSAVYDVRADVWSLGMSLVELGTGRFPIDGFRTEFEIIALIISDKPPTLPPEGQFSDAFTSFVSSCLQKDVNQRPKYIELMNTEFYLRHNVEPLDILSWYQDVTKEIAFNSPSYSSNNEVSQIYQVMECLSSTLTLSDSAVQAKSTESLSSSSSSNNTIINSNGCHQKTQIQQVNSLAEILTQETKPLSPNHVGSVKGGTKLVRPVNHHRAYMLCLPADNDYSLHHHKVMDFVSSASERSSRRRCCFKKPSKSNNNKDNNSNISSGSSSIISAQSSSAVIRSFSQPRRFLMLETDL